jgi:hypothetical protein
MAMRSTLLGLAVSAVLLAGSCMSPVASPVPTEQPASRPVLGVENGTTLVVTIFVNGQPMATVNPGTALDPILFSSLPGFPLEVEARSASGRVLTTMHVNADTVTSTTDPTGNLHATGALGRVDLSCGRLTIWAGFSPSGPFPGPGSPGDCNP